MELIIVVTDVEGKKEREYTVNDSNKNFAPLYKWAWKEAIRLKLQKDNSMWGRLFSTTGYEGRRAFVTRIK